jgi:hypothetical protein
MLQDTMVWLFNLFVVEPAQAELTERLATARAPQAVVRQVVACATAAGPVLAERAAADLGWATTTVVRVWTGSVAPEAVLRDAVPACGSALDAAKPFLEGLAA